MVKRKEVTFNEKQWEEIEKEANKLNITTTEYIKLSCNKNIILSNDIKNFMKQSLEKTDMANN